MPLYEYECEACGKRFEVIQRFSDPAPDACRTCGKGPMRRLASSPAIQFKGSGFYITDYAKKSAPDSSGDTSKGDAAKTGGAGEAGTGQAGKTESGKSESGTSGGTASDSGKRDHAPAPAAASKGESTSKSDGKADTSSSSSSAKPSSTGS